MIRFAMIATILVILTMGCSGNQSANVPAKATTQSVATPATTLDDSTASARKNESRSLASILTDPAFYSAPEDHMGEYQFINANGGIIVVGNNWPGAIDLAKGQQFVYKSDLPAHKGRKEVFFYFKDGNYQAANVSIDGQSCRVAKIYQSGELIDQWPLQIADYRAECTVVWYVCDSISKPTNRLVVKANAPLNMGIPYPGTVFWAYLPQYRKGS